jgi:nucleoid-associated protein YgaU
LLHFYPERAEYAPSLKELFMCKAATFGLVAVLMLVAGAMGCHRDNPENATNEAGECAANAPTNVVENAPPTTESATTLPTTSTASAESGPATTESSTTMSTTMDNGGSRLPADNGSAANEAPSHTDLGGTDTTEKTYIVKAGDNLWLIAKAEYHDASKHDLIAKANPNIDPTNLKVGSKLVIPPLPSSGTSGDGGTQVQHPGDTAGETYTVVSGDTLWTIAQKHYGNGAKAKLIEQANPGIKGTLHIGQKIVLPPDATPAPTPTTSDSTSTSRPHKKKPAHKKPADDSTARPLFN